MTPKKRNCKRSKGCSNVSKDLDQQNSERQFNIYKNRAYIYH